MKAVLYCRVSTGEQNPENQKIELERYAKAMNYNYITFEETESTRKTRPIKDKILRDAIKREYDIIIVYKLDRWARSMSELLNDFNLLRSNNVQFKTLHDNIIIDNNPANILMVNIFSAFAQFERDIIRERTLAGLNRARLQGKKLGYPRGKKRK